MREATIVGQGEGLVPGHDGRVIAVRVVDHSGHEHRVLVGWNGTVLGLSQDRFADDGESEGVLDRVRQRARYEAHSETEADFLAPHEDPAVLLDALGALESLEADRSLALFGDYLRALRSPPPAPGDVELVGVDAHLTEYRKDVAATSEPFAYYQGASGLETTDYDSPGGEPDVRFQLPPEDPGVESGGDLREFLVGHVRCRIRDLHLIQGREPPALFAVEGPGIPSREVVPFEDQAK